MSQRSDFKYIITMKKISLKNNQNNQSKNTEDLDEEENYYYLNWKKQGIDAYKQSI